MGRSPDAAIRAATRSAGALESRVRLRPGAADRGSRRIEGIEAKYGYSLAGEQVDGYFVLDHRHFLLEAKWHEVPIAASEVFSFQGKLRGKLIGTLGLFVSAGTFAAGTSSALVRGKDIDVLLVDRDDIELALEIGRSFAEMVRAKLRVAAQKGDVYFRYRRWLELPR